MSHLLEEKALELQEKGLCICVCLPYEDCCGAGPCLDSNCYDEEDE